MLKVSQLMYGYASAVRGGRELNRGCSDPGRYFAGCDFDPYYQNQC
jgi:hypothetical protein